MGYLNSVGNMGVADTQEDMESVAGIRNKPRTPRSQWIQDGGCAGSFGGVDGTGAGQKSGEEEEVKEETATANEVYQRRYK